jgi:hypothetical protein
MRTDAEHVLGGRAEGIGSVKMEPGHARWGQLGSLTTPHKLQGRGTLGKPSRAGRGFCPPRKPMAAP